MSSSHIRAPAALLRASTPTHPMSIFFFLNDTATTEISTLSLHDALPISRGSVAPAERQASDRRRDRDRPPRRQQASRRSEEHTSELQSRLHLVCRLLLEKKKHGIRRAPFGATPNQRQPPDSLGIRRLVVV